jgi:predicted TIM-barrel fold metal-dependent hydrolase
MAESRWPVIDTHFHIGVNSLVTFLAEDELIPWMDEAGTDVQIVFQLNEGYMHRTPEWNPYIGNDYVSKVQKLFPERVIGLAHVNPFLQAPKKYYWPSKREGDKWDKLPTRNEALEEVERSIVDLGLWGLKMHPYLHGYPVNFGPIIFPMMDLLVQLQKKVNRQLMLGIHAAGDHIFNSSEAVGDLASRYPDLLFLMYHSGFIWGCYSLNEHCAKHPNLLLDMTTCPQKGVVWTSYKKYGADKFCVGTDGPFVGHHVRTSIVHDLTGDNYERELILGGNLAKRLNIPKLNT